MCGIVGIVSDKDISKELLVSMTNALIHRGPDDGGEFIGEGYAFGHRRLSIVDLSSAGHQPMQYIDKYVITYNGEIYNYLELRNELESAGYKFNSNTDTEVIMASYDYWGVECLNKFNGMWAFVLYNKVENNYFISRDRFGVKPLYIYIKNDLFVFASEPKAILAHTQIEIKPNKKFLLEYIKNGAQEFIAETAFSDIYRFPRSSYFVGGAKEIFDNFSTHKFWTLNPNLSTAKFCSKKAEVLATQYYNLLSDAVRLRLRADVKVGSALSGGLDSSSIVYLVNQHLKEHGEEAKQETFSSVYKTKGTEDCDESEFINLMANELKVKSNQIEPLEKNIPDEHSKMIWSMDNPPEGTCMSGWHTFKKVSESKVKVTLDGQGADEQLAGYLLYISTYLTSLSIYDFYKEFRYFLKIPGARKFVYRAYLMNHFKLIFGRKALIYFVERLLGKTIQLDLNSVLEASINNNLVNLLNYADRLSMGNSIESRMPFMDYRLVEFLASIPACYKMHNGWTKYIARLAFNNKLPDKICWRVDKMGWPEPEKKWFEGGLEQWVKISIGNSGMLDSLISSNEKNTDNLNVKIRLLNVAVFSKIFFKKNESVR